MSKKNRHRDRQTSGLSSSASQLSPAAQAPVNAALVSEYRVIKHDLIRVLLVNVIFLAGVLALYYSNLHSHWLDSWFSGLVNF